MCSANFVDFLAEKLFSFSSKMREDSFQHYGTSCLMNGNYNSHHWDPQKAVNIFREYGFVDFEVANPCYPNILLSQVIGMLKSIHSLKFQPNLERSEYFSHAKHGLFSPHLLNLIVDLNSYCNRKAVSEMSLMPCSSIYFGNMTNSLFGDSRETKQMSKAESNVKMTCSSPVSEFTMSVNAHVSHSPAKKSDVTDKKCNVSTNVKLNLKLANRKTKQMNKRSKKRRRRQKKSQNLYFGNAATLSDDDDANSNCSSSSGSVCFIDDSPDFGCTVSFQHTPRMPSCVSSFIVPVESDSDDDSEWETYDETDNCNTNSYTTSDSEPDCEILSSYSSPVKSESTDSRFSMSPMNLASSIVSFVIPVGDSSDDDSEWDSGEPGTFTETSDFEFTGLFLTNLCSPQTFSSSVDCNLNAASRVETVECWDLKKLLLEVNENWNELTKGDSMKLKSPPKVTFASDEDLVEVFPVEICERKGEWEIYATERLRFKRKIDELEKVLSPCLNPEHRSKVYKKLMESEL